MIVPIPTPCAGMTRHSAAAGDPTGLTPAGGGVILSATITGDLQHMATLNKDDLAADLLGNLDQLTAAEARRTVDRLLNRIADALARGDDVKLYGFGNFTRATIKPRRGRNPKTGEAIDIPETAYVTFSASKALKARLVGRS